MQIEAENELSYDSSAELMPRAFSLEEDDDNAEAIQYLLSVREEAQSLGKYTTSNTEHIVLKESSEKFWPKSKIILPESIGDKEWCQDVLQQFRNVKIVTNHYQDYDFQNIQSAREWLKKVGKETFEKGLIGFDQKNHEQLIGLRRKRSKFIENYNKENSIQPTIYYMMQVDYKNSARMIEWISSQSSKRLNKSKIFWTYCLLSQIDEDLVDSDTMGNINSILKKCIDDMRMDKEENKGMYCTLISIIVYVFKQQII